MKLSMLLVGIAIPAGLLAQAIPQDNRLLIRPSPDFLQPRQQILQMVNRGQASGYGLEAGRAGGRWLPNGQVPNIEAVDQVFGIALADKKLPPAARCGTQVGQQQRIFPLLCNGSAAGVATPLQPMTDVFALKILQQQLQDYKAQCSEVVRQIGARLRTHTPDANPSLRDRYRHCLASLNVLPSGHREWLSRRLVVLTVAPPEAGRILPCTGLAISQELIVTAKHCFYPLGPADARQDLVAADAVRVHRLADSETGLSIAGPIMDADGIALPARPPAGLASNEASVGDIAFVRTAVPLDLGATVPVTLAERLPDNNIPVTRVLVPGFHGILATDPLTSLPTPMDDFLGLDLSGGCMVTRFQGASCYAHSCQTGPGLSGAPVLSLAGDGSEFKAYLLGIHSGAGSNEELCRARIPAQHHTAWRGAAVNIANFPVGKLFGQ